MTTDTLLLGWISFLGTLFWPLNPDAALLMYIGGRGRPLPVGVVVALVGQVAMMLLLHLLGHHLRRHWTWLDRKCATFERKWGARLQAKTPLVAATSGFFGIPPGAATVLLASALNLPARRLLPVLFAFRVLWLIALGHLGSALTTPQHSASPSPSLSPSAICHPTRDSIHPAPKQPAPAQVDTDRKCSTTKSWTFTSVRSNSSPPLCASRNGSRGARLL